MISASPPHLAVHEAVVRALAEDLGPLGDLTAALVPRGTFARGRLVPRVDGVLAGRSAVDETFALVDTAVRVSWDADDGESMSAGRPVASVSGSLASLLTAERTALNFLCHLSGVATLTRRYVQEAATAGRAAIRDTRKTTPGLRALEKAAVRAGGGLNHRASLSDGILVKDNHLTGLSIVEVVARARASWPGRAVQVECDTAAQVDEALASGADLVLLDNMAPDEVALLIGVIGGRCLVEVSGGVSLANVAAFSAAGADLISVGALTHSAAIVDIGLDIDPVANTGSSTEGRPG